MVSVRVGTAPQVTFPHAWQMCSATAGMSYGVPDSAEKHLYALGSNGMNPERERRAADGTKSGGACPNHLSDLAFVNAGPAPPLARLFPEAGMGNRVTAALRGHLRQASKCRGCRTGRSCGLSAATEPTP